MPWACMLPTTSPFSCALTAKALPPPHRLQPPALVGVVKSATLGDSSVTYDTAALTAGTESWGDLNATTYGQMLANRAKLIGAAGSYVI